MMTINAQIIGGTSAVTTYIPAPCRGVVTGLRAVFNTAPAADDTVTVSRGNTAVNLLTTGGTAVGTVYPGVRDTTNKELVFDPASSTAANRVIKVVVSALPTANTLVGVQIDFDEFALVSQ